MLVGERMTKDTIVVRDDTPIDEAMKLMRDNKVRRLPVLNNKGALVGMVSERDLLYVSPSPATSLSIHEIHYLVSRITVGEIMTEDVITVSESAPLEEAARIMADNKIGGLPVVSDGELVGIITETDLFKIFLELLGAREMGVRLAMLVPDEEGVLAKVTGAIAELGGNIVSLGTFLGEDPTNALLTIKVQDVEEEDLVKAMEPLAMEIVDVRMCEERR
ncbi:MAG: CBS domain-containing protein [Anaerolineales bacterium]|nr:MAG: CBS domain-containing protein [Anaerolineales bacterium]